ncbi:MAG: tRNA lysidine(34) synthetase TilS [Bryobacteraceae bacterium]
MDAVRKNITRYNMLAPGTRVAVAVSGGPDSVCLLHVLAAIAPELGLTLSVAHFNHKLRGEDSELDERFVAQLAEKLAVPFHCDSADLKQHSGNLEQAARRARRAFFARLIKEGLIDKVALGHTRDDQAETVLFRLLRGSGLTGLAGILPVTADGVIRPLIGITRKDVLEYLTSQGIRWREDASNLEPRFARNRIRHSLLPQLSKDWNPNLSESLAHLADLAYEEERVWADIVNRAAAESFEQRVGGVEFTCESVLRFPKALRRRLIRRAIADTRGDLRRIEYEHVEVVLELLKRKSGGGRRRLPGLLAQRSFEWMRLEGGQSASPLQETQLEIPGSYPIDGDNTLIRLELFDGPSAPNPCVNLKATELYLGDLTSPLVLDGPLVLRGWRSGDHYWPAGDSRERTIQELFQSARVPSWRRRDWPMITCGTKILWIRQFGVAKEFAAGARSGRILRVAEIVAGGK